MIKITKRLETIFSLVPINSQIIDIGCDHGLLDVYLYQAKKSSHIIATDINKYALNNAKENIKKYKVNIETRLGNGLDILTEDDKIDTIIMSGLGAHTIVGILKNNLKKLKKISTIIIQSNTKIEFLRKEIIKLNYLIDDEALVEDNHKIYTVIRFVKGNKKYTKRELYFGPILLQKNTKLFQETNKKELKKLQVLLKLMPRNHILDRHKIRKEINLYKF